MVLARTLVTEPAVVLFDEPMAALDRRLRDYMAIELRNIQKRLGFAAIYVTHDQETASSMSDRLAIMHRGRIAAHGTLAELIRSYPARISFAARDDSVPSSWPALMEKSITS